MDTKAPTTARRAVKTATPEPEDAKQILEITSASSAPPEEEREPLFSVDGEQFTVPRKVTERVVFLALNAIRKDGPIFSAMYVMELLLGSAQYTRLLALYEKERITQEQFDQVSGLINNIFFDHFKDDPDAAGKGSPTS